MESRLSVPGDRRRYTAIGMLLIETLPNETDDALRVVIDEMLSTVWGASEGRWWRPYELGRVFELAARRYREFICPAGSVSAHLIHAAQSKTFSRNLIVTGYNGDGSAVGQLIGRDETLAFDPGSLVAV